MMAKNILSIYNRAEVPVRGMRSAVDPSDLKAGEFQLLQNLRSDRGLDVRAGIAAITNALPCTNAILRGCWAGELNGTEYQIAAYDDGSKTRIYSLNFGTGAWTELTETTGWHGPSGNNRLTMPNETRANVTAATNASPCVISVDTAHRLLPGDRVVISGSVGNTAINGTFYVLTTPTTLTFTISANIGGSAVAGNGAWISGGTVFAPLGTEVIFIPVRAPRGDYNTSVRRPQDVLLIGNGEDHWRVYVPLETVVTGLAVHRPLSLPSNAIGRLRQLALPYSYWQCASSSGKTYASAAGPPRVNQTAFAMADSSAVYTGSDAVPQIDRTTGANATRTVTAATNASPSVITTSVAHTLVVGDRVAITGSGGNTAINGTWYVATVPTNATFTISATDGGTGVAGNGVWTAGGTVTLYTDVATVQFSAPLAIAGDQVAMALEGTPVSIQALLARCAIDLNQSSSAYASILTSWARLYDPNGSSSVNSYQLIALDAANNRYLALFSASHLSSSAGDRSARHLRFVWAAAAASTAVSVKILSVFAGWRFRAGVQWAISYEDQQARSESFGIEPSRTDYELLRNAGGPSTLTLYLPNDSRVYYDYQLEFLNSTASTPITGGLDGEPSVVNIYYRTGAGLTAYYASNVKLWTATAGSPKTWVKANTGAVITIRVSDSSLVITPDNFRDPSRDLPSSFQISVPIASQGMSAVGRLFVGSVKDTASGTTYSKGDLYYSELYHPFRFQAILESDARGSRNVVYGERVTGFRSTASPQLGASSLYVFTDQNLYELGGAFAQTNSSNYTAGALTAMTRRGAAGTNSPRSIDEYHGHLFWVSNEFQVMHMAPGTSPKSISRFAVDSTLKAVPAARRTFLEGRFWQDRYYLAYTEAGGSTNTRVLGYNLILGEWEFDDLLPTPCTAERLMRWYNVTANGSGLRMFIFSSDGLVYEHETGTLDLGAKIATRIKIRELRLPGWQNFSIEEVLVMVDADTGVTLTVNRYGKPNATQFTSTALLTALSGNTVVCALDTTPHTETVDTLGLGETNWAWYLDITASMTGGRRFHRIEALLKGSDASAGTRP